MTDLGKAFVVLLHPALCEDHLKAAISEIEEVVGVLAVLPSEAFRDELKLLDVLYPKEREP